MAAEFLGEKQRGGCIREKEKKKKAEVQSLEKTELRQRGVSAQWGVQKQNEGKTRKSGNWEEGFVWGGFGEKKKRKEKTGRHGEARRLRGARKGFANLRRTSDEVNFQLRTKFSQELEPIDWEFY